MNVKRIAVLVGSLRKASYTKKIAENLFDLAPNTLKLEIIHIGDLPHYNQDLDDENRPPQAWTDFRQQMRAFDGVLFLTPEYNRSIPGVLKNAIDVGSRPYGKSIWEKKPGGVISVSPGGLGAFGANHHLRQCFVFLDVPLLQQPEAYIGNVTQLLDDSGKINNDKSRDILKTYMNSFAEWVERNTPMAR